MGELPVSASSHPPRWKFDFPIFHPQDVAAWRAWLDVHHETERGAWVASWRKTTGRPAPAYVHLVEEAICFGWIDSTVNTLDDERSLQLMTPRKPKSSWTRLNRARVAALEAEGRMTPAGLRTVEVAKDNGWWLLYDPVEDLIEPPDLAAALDASGSARAAWDTFAPSARKQMLWWGDQRCEAGDQDVARREGRCRGRARPTRPRLSRRAQGWPTLPDQPPGPRTVRSLDAPPRTRPRSGEQRGWTLG